MYCFMPSVSHNNNSPKGTGTATYVADMAVSTAQLTSGNIVTTAQYQSSALGDVWSVSDSSGAYSYKLESHTDKY